MNKHSLADRIKWRPGHYVFDDGKSVNTLNHLVLFVPSSNMSERQGQEHLNMLRYVSAVTDLLLDYFINSKKGV